MTGPRSGRRRGPFFFFFLLVSSAPRIRQGYPRCAILQQGMHLNVFSKVYYDRVYFSCAECIMTGSGFDPPSGTPYPLEKSSAPPPPGEKSYSLSMTCTCVNADSFVYYLTKLFACIRSRCIHRASNTLYIISLEVTALIYTAKTLNFGNKIQNIRRQND